MCRGWGTPRGLVRKLWIGKVVGMLVGFCEVVSGAFLVARDSLSLICWLMMSVRMSVSCWVGCPFVISVLM